MLEQSRSEAGKMLRFAIVGAGNTAISLVAYVLLLHFGIPYLPSAALAYAAGIVNGYTWNRSWTFEAGDFHLPEFSRFVSVQLLGLGLNTLLLAIAVQQFDASHLAGEVLSLIPVVAITYGLNRLWTFREREA